MSASFCECLMSVLSVPYRELKLGLIDGAKLEYKKCKLLEIEMLCLILYLVKEMHITFQEFGKACLELHFICIF